MFRIILSCLIFAMVLTGCSKGDTPKVSDNVFKQDWSQIEAAAEGTEVRMYMWGGDDNVNRYMDQWVAPRLKEQYGVTLVRTPMNAPEFMQKLMTEKKANSLKGTMDIVWINGENFKNVKANDLLSEPFVQILPNYNSFVDGNSNNIIFDFGTPVDGKEAPWGKVQFVYLYDSAKVKNPPANFTELAQWVKENPGKFTYPDPNDFTGNAFLRHLLYQQVGVETLIKEGYNPSLVSDKSKVMWSYLKDIKPYLWKKGQTYPQSLTQLDQMYSQGEVWINMGYNEARAEALIKQGVFPKTTKSFIMDPGSIGNTHFLAIPYNSPNVAGALVAINFLLSPDAQLAKMDPAGWGDNTVLDINKLPVEYKNKLDNLQRGASVLKAEDLANNLLPEFTPEYVNWIKETWLSEVGKTSN